MKGTGSITLALSDLQWLQRFAAMLARDADEADDLVQETLVVAWAHPPRDTEESARPWLATVLRNLFRMQRRAGARRELRERIGSSASATTSEPEGELARLEVLRILLGELEVAPKSPQRGEDLGGDQSGAVTIAMTMIGAPDIGTIYDDVELIETTFADKEVLQCLIQSMYGWVGEAPAEAFERRPTRTFVLGELEGDTKERRIFEAIIGAHIGEVRWCEKRGDPEAGEVRGRLLLAYALADDADGKTRAKTLTVRATDLPREVVDCIVSASQRWIFPPALRDKTFEYQFVLPVPPGRPALR